MKMFYWIFVTISAMLSARAAPAELKIENIQAAYGRFGPVRKTLTVTAYDDIFFYFDVVGVKADDQGKVNLVIRVEVNDPTGKAVLKNENPIKDELSLGGARSTGMAKVTFAGSPPAGQYSVKVTVLDQLSGSQASFERALNCQPEGFHLVGPQFFYDANATLPAPVGGLPGQILHVRVKAVGFDPKADKLDTEMQLQVLDSNGKEVMPKALVESAREEDAEKARKILAVTFKTPLALTRPGNFTLRIVVKDQVAKKTETFQTPLHVAPLPASTP